MAQFTPQREQPGVDPVSVGAWTFYSQEVDHRFAFGGVKGRVVVSEYVGGGRNVGGMGAQPKPVTLDVSLYAARLKPCITLMRSYAVAQQEIFVSYFFEKYYAIITDVQPTYVNAYRAGLTLEFEITRDGNGALSPSAAAASIDQQVAALQQVAISQFVIAPPAIGVSPSQIAAVSLNIQAATPLAQASQSQLQNVLTSIAPVVSSLETYLLTADPSSAGFVSATRMLGAFNLITQNATAGQSSQTIQVTGGDVWDLGSQYYGDVSQGLPIMQLNNMTSPTFPSGVKTVVRLLPLIQTAAA